MNVLGLMKTTLLDYPGKVAATIFVGGCNFRCPFCHNRDIVLQENMAPIRDDDILAFLNKRRNILQGVCISGGEPTLYSTLPTFLYKIKELGYDIKLDTNGSNPDMIRELTEGGLIDYCAMDIKNSFEKYDLTCGFSDCSHVDIDKIKESINFLMCQNSIDYEFRTTIVKELHTSDDIISIAKYINGAKHYYLQSYKDCNTLTRQGYSPYDSSDLIVFANMCKEYVLSVSVRGI